MEHRRILIDTSIIIEYIRKHEKSKTLFWQLLQRSDCLISTVTEFELYSGIKHDEDVARMDKLLSFVEILDFDSYQAQKAAEIFRALKRQNKLIEYRDIFIAASALSANLPLATLNHKHFKRIEGLTLI